MTLLDGASAEDAHIARRLASAPLAWFGSVRPDGRPHQVPVWFGWRDRTVAVFSPAGAQKVRNLRANSACTLGVESADGGNDVVLVDGTAELLAPGGAAALAVEVGFEAKYLHVMGDAWFPQWLPGFGQPIRVRVARIVAWSKSEGELRYRVTS